MLQVVICKTKAAPNHVLVRILTAAVATDSCLVWFIFNFVVQFKQLSLRLNIVTWVDQSDTQQLQLVVLIPAEFISLRLPPNNDSNQFKVLEG